jgi:hypothetical protein
MGQCISKSGVSIASTAHPAVGPQGRSSGANAATKDSPATTKKRSSGGMLSALPARDASISTAKLATNEIAPPRSLELPADTLRLIAARLEGKDLATWAIANKSHLAALKHELTAERLAANVRSSAPTSLAEVEAILRQAKALGPMFTTPVLGVLGRRLDSTPDVERQAILKVFNQAVASLPGEHREKAEEALRPAAGATYQIHPNAVLAERAILLDSMSAKDAAAKFRITDLATLACLERAEGMRGATFTEKQVTLAQSRGRSASRRVSDLFTQLRPEYAGSVTEENLNILAEALARDHLKQPEIPGSVGEARLSAYKELMAAQFAVSNAKDPASIEVALQTHMPVYVAASLKALGISG